jgi:hypothetical protein
MPDLIHGYPAEQVIGHQIVGVYDGVCAWQLPDGRLVNRWTPEHGRRYQLTQDWIDAQQAPPRVEG